MSRNTVIQIIIFIILALSVFLIFKKYSPLNNEIKLKDFEKKEVNDFSNNNKNVIKDIKYISGNNIGDKYESRSDYGEIDHKNPDLIFLHNVQGIIKLVNGDNIYIKSKFANFNSKSFETKFIDDVKITRKDEIITGGQLYLVLEVTKDELKKNPNKEQNLIRMSEKVTYNKPGYTLKTDIVEIDLLTKNSKIYMNNSFEKVIVNKFNK